MSFCRALARNCNAAIDDKKGATAKQWREGKPVRVVSHLSTLITHTSTIPSHPSPLPSLSLLLRCVTTKDERHLTMHQKKATDTMVFTK